MCVGVKNIMHNLVAKHQVRIKLWTFECKGRTCPSTGARGTNVMRSTHNTFAVDLLSTLYVGGLGVNLQHITVWLRPQNHSPKLSLQCTRLTSQASYLVPTESSHRCCSVSDRVRLRHQAPLPSTNDRGRQRWSFPDHRRQSLHFRIQRHHEVGNIPFACRQVAWFAS